MITFGSLFAGIGGFDLGFERCGMQCKWQVEIDEYATRILERHWPDVHRQRDIKQCGRHNLERVDVIIGGFPCQDISYAGKGAGLDGERSGLFFEAIRLVRELRPRAVVLENVAGLLTRGLDRVLGTLAEIGFDAEWHCIPAAAVGAPHIRDRVFIIGTQHSNSDSFGLCANAKQRQKQQGADASRDSRAGHSADVANAERAQRRTQPEAWHGEQDRQNEGRKEAAGRSTDGGSDVPNTEKQGLEGPDAKGYSRTAGFAGKPRPWRWQDDWWATEPDVGRIIDGFSAWLDGNIGLVIQSHKRIMTYVINQHGDCNGDAQKERAEQVLQDLRDRFSPEGVQWTTGGLVSVSSQEILFAYLCKHTIKTANEARLQLQGEKASKVNLRSLRSRQELAGSPCGSGQEQQCPGEYSNSMQALSRLLAHDARKAWLEYCGENALPVLSEWGPGWEVGVSRVAHGVPARVDRLRCLGNAIVPQVAEVVGRILLERIGGDDDLLRN